MTTIELILSSAVTLKLIDIFYQSLKDRIDRKRGKKDATQKQLDRIETTLNSHIKADELYKADQCRTRILRFSDELRRGVKHSEESFNNILEDIDFYVNYCNSNADVYVNSKADAAIRNIKDVYDQCVCGALKFL